MIIRSGFVSNSSSSSFIIAYPKALEEQGIQEVYQLLTGKTADEYPGQDILETTTTLIDSWYTDDTDIEEVNDYQLCSRVLNDIKNREVSSDDEILKRLEQRHWYEAWNTYRNDKAKQKAYCKEHGLKDLAAFKELVSNYYGDTPISIKSIRYSDEEGEDWLEHSDIFWNIPNITINEH